MYDDGFKKEVGIGGSLERKRQATLQAIVKKVCKGKIRSVQRMCARREELRRVGLDYFEEVLDHMS